MYCHLRKWLRFHILYAIWRILLQPILVCRRILAFPLRFSWKVMHKIRIAIVCSIRGWLHFLGLCYPQREMLVYNEFTQTKRPLEVQSCPMTTLFLYWVISLLKLRPSGNFCFFNQMHFFLKSNSFDFVLFFALNRIWNYSKTPSRGVKDFCLSIDGNTIFMGSLLISHE